MPYNITLAGNRSGKTVYVACKHIWKNFYKIVGPGKSVSPLDWSLLEYQTFNVAPHSNLTKIMFRMIMNILRGKFSIPQEDGSISTNRCLITYFIDDESLSNPTEPPKASPYILRFANGTAFNAYTLGGTHGDSVQGDKFGYGSYDEFGRSKDPDKEFIDIKTRLADLRGELDIITTPDETNPDACDWLEARIEESSDSESGFRFLTWSTSDNEFMSKESVDQLTLGLTDSQKRQVLKGSIIKQSVRYFPYKKIDLMFEKSRISLPYIDFVHTFPDPKHLYWAGLDSSGLGKDVWGFYVLDTTSKPFHVVYKYATKGISPTDNKSATRRVVEDFYDAVGRNRFRWQVDATGQGGNIIYDDLCDLQPIKFSFGIQKGTGKIMKFDLMETMRKAFQEEALVFSYEDADFMNQARLYRGPAADASQKTDLVMALGLALYVPFNESYKGPSITFHDFN